MDLAAYRIVQESLTNVTRHSAATNVTVSLDWEPATGTVRLRITDDGGTPGTTAAGAPSGPGGTGSDGSGSAGAGSGGTGIRGMAERARALGGTLTAGPSGGGFAVDARLPTTLTPQEGTPS